MPVGGLTTPAATDVLDGITPWHQVDNQLFKAYYDKTFKFATNGFYNTLGMPPMIQKKFSVKWKKRWVYSSNGSNSVDEYDSSLLFFSLTDYVTPNLVQQGLNIYAKTTFVE